MRMEEFGNQYGADARPIGDVINRWVAEKRMADFLGTPAFAGVLVADILRDGSLLDRLPSEVQAGFRKLMGDAANTRAEIIMRLTQEAEEGPRHLEGLLSKIQGQIGENEFIRSVGPRASLASSGSQIGWDVAVRQDAGNRYVQVKVYADPDEVIERIQELEQRMVSGAVTGVDGEVVRSIDVAVNSDVYDEVEARVEELGLSTRILDLGVERDGIRAALAEAAENATEPLGNFFGELLGDVGSAAALHAAVNGFLVWKGAKSAGEATEDTAYSSVISAGGLAAAFGAEALVEEAVFGQLDSAVAVLSGPIGGLVSIAAGIYVRGVLRRLGERRHIVERLEIGNRELVAQVERCARC